MVHGTVHRAAAPGTVRSAGASSGAATGSGAGVVRAGPLPECRREPGACQGATHTRACGPSARGPSAVCSAATVMSRCQPRSAVRAARNSRVRSAPARTSSASSAPIRAATSMAAVSCASVGPGSSSSSHTYPSANPRWRTGRQTRPRCTPASGVGGIRTGPVARVMPKLSNQARTWAVERRVRIERVLTGSRSGASRPSPPSCAPKAISSKSRFSSVAGAPSRVEISSTSSW
ncbi:hypothetical protein SMD44_06132 [Streptomyces alboflavus]|uniref:Uncharacterized protein n=1 Tax=Streptomyces alboflavus TaxID=67267 RepID=A0A1Z1WJU3_9ACTN|nr:hypothetical protein SMD44_06132 [Streptomyces alboflavus]